MKFFEQLISQQPFTAITCCHCRFRRGWTPGVTWSPSLAGSQAGGCSAHSSCWGQLRTTPGLRRTRIQAQWSDREEDSAPDRRGSGGDRGGSGGRGGRYGGGRGRGGSFAPSRQGQGRNFYTSGRGSGRGRQDSYRDSPSGYPSRSGSSRGSGRGGGRGAKQPREDSPWFDSKRRELPEDLGRPHEATGDVEEWVGLVERHLEEDDVHPGVYHGGDRDRGQYSDGNYRGEFSGEGRGGRGGRSPAMSGRGRGTK